MTCTPAQLRRPGCALIWKGAVDLDGVVPLDDPGLFAGLPVARPARAPPLFTAAGETQSDEYESAP